MLENLLATADVPELVFGRAGSVEAHCLERRGERLHAPVVGRVAGQVIGDERPDVLVEERPDGLAEVLVAKDLVALGVDRLALAVDHVVELDDALAHVEVEALDPALRAFDRLADEPALDRDVVLEAHPLHQPGDPVRGEPLHQVVLEGQVEARRARIALAAGPAAELVVDPPAVVALCADDVQPTDADDALVILVGDRLRLGQGGSVRLLVDLGRVQAALVEDLRCEAGGIAAEQNVGATTGHVRRDRDRTGPARLGDDPRFLLVELRVERLVLDPAALEHRGQDLGLLDADRADEDGPAGLVHLGDLVD